MSTRLLFLLLLLTGVVLLTLSLSSRMDLIFVLIAGLFVLLAGYGGACAGAEKSAEATRKLEFEKQAVEVERRKKILKGVVTTLATQFVFAFERLGMVLGQVFETKGERSLTKTTICDFSEFSLTSELIHLNCDSQLIAATTFLQDRYFHIKQQLDQGAKRASRVDALKEAAKSHEAEQLRIEARFYIGTAVGFATNLPDTNEGEDYEENFLCFHFTEPLKS